MKTQSEMIPAVLSLAVSSNNSYSFIALFYSIVITEYEDSVNVM